MQWDDCPVSRLFPVWDGSVWRIDTAAALTWMSPERYSRALVLVYSEKGKGPQNTYLYVWKKPRIGDIGLREARLLIDVDKAVSWHQMLWMKAKDSIPKFTRGGTRILYQFGCGVFVRRLPRRWSERIVKVV